MVRRANAHLQRSGSRANVLSWLFSEIRRKASSYRSEIFSPYQSGRRGTKFRARSSGTGQFCIRKRGAITLPVLLDSQSRKGLKGQTVHFGSRRNCFPLNKCPKIGMSYLWGPKRFPEAGSFSRHIGLSLNQYRFT